MFEFLSRFGRRAKPDVSGEFLRILHVENRQTSEVVAKFKIREKALYNPNKNQVGELMDDPDPENSKRLTDAMLKMQKIICILAEGK